MWNQIPMKERLNKTQFLNMDFARGYYVGRVVTIDNEWQQLKYTIAV